MKGQFQLWLLLVALLIIGLAAPFVSQISAAVTTDYSDTASQIAIWLMLPVLVILVAYFGLFYDR
jgi:hypothetical protein